ncbi:MAG: hypothetical protein K0S24_2253 [Sphingobacterium sp.]|jgi:hypothetical protein|nr:hypothetical protein [Sphingobacterium sp.]
MIKLFLMANLIINQHFDGSGDNLTRVSDHCISKS